MPFLSILIALVLGVLALAFVLYPLYHHRLVRAEQSTSASPSSVSTKSTGSTVQQTPADEEMALITNSKLASLEHEQSARAAIQEVELDYQLGNISEADYRALRERYLRRALVAMKSRYDHDDHDDREQELDESIEARLRQMREQHERDEQ